MKKHLNLKIFGQVQGVFFRHSTQAIAEKLGITGFVRNETDGTVYIEAEAEEKLLTEFVAWCHSGPRLANVDRVVLEAGKLQNYQSFSLT